MKRFLIIVVILIGFGINAQAQQTSMVCIFGNVVDAKRLVLIETLTLTKTIEQAGGIKVKKRNFFSRAKTEARIYRIIEGSKERELIRIDFGKILKGRAQDVALKPYDLIEVTCPKKSCGTLSRDMKLLFGKEIFLVD